MALTYVTDRDVPDIRPDNPAFFLYPVSGRIPDMAAGYPAKYAAKEKHLNTAYNILQLFDFM